MNPVLLQKQLKENANDLQDFFKDLKGWGEEMKRKEAHLKEEAPKEKPKTSKKVKKTNGTIVGGVTDYSKWEKFDAELECERLEEDYEEDSELTDEFEHSARDEALVYKEKGNSYVKMKEWDKAIDCYTKAINSYSYDPIFYANRALCYLKQNNFAAAEEDCSISLKIDSTYVKAFQRRAAAREALGKLQQAKSDLDIVLTYEPRNKESRAALEAICKKFSCNVNEDEPRLVSKFTASRTKMKPSVEIGNCKTDTSSSSADSWPDPGCEIVLVKAVNKPARLQSKKPLKRIEIVETDSLAGPVKKHVVAKFIPAVDMRAAGEPPVSAFKKTHLVTKSHDDVTVMENKPKTAKNSENISLVQQAPKSAVQFYSAWKNLKSIDEKYEFLKSIEPKELPNIFKESLESHVFSGILEVLSVKAVNSEDMIYEVLLMLTKVQRFYALTMFMDAKDKNRLWKLIDYLREDERVSKEKVDFLIKQYEL